MVYAVRRADASQAVHVLSGIRNAGTPVDAWACAMWRGGPVSSPTPMFPELADLAGGATFSPDRVYRYALWRHWQRNGRVLNWLMLNPSTADEVTLDPTITRCVGFARAWGYGGIVVTNLFGLRSTDPRALRSVADPVGAENNQWIAHYARRATDVVAAWGNHGTYQNRAGRVIAMFQQSGVALQCLGVNHNGQPKHPLYIAGDTRLSRYAPMEQPA